MHIRLVSIKRVVISLLLSRCFLCINAADCKSIVQPPAAAGATTPRQPAAPMPVISAHVPIGAVTSSKQVLSSLAAIKRDRENYIVSEFNKVVVPYLAKIHGPNVRAIIQTLLLNSSEGPLISIKDSPSVVEITRHMRTILIQPNYRLGFAEGAERIILFVS